MDTAYGKLGLPFVQALSVLATVISVSARLGRGRLRAQGAGHGPRQPVRRGGRGVVLLGRAPHVRPGIPAPGRGPHPGAPRARRPDRGLPRLTCSSSTATRCSSAGTSTCGAGDARVRTSWLAALGGARRPGRVLPDKGGRYGRHHVHHRGRRRVQRRTLRRGEQGGRRPGRPRAHPPGGRARAPQRPGPPRPARHGGGRRGRGPPPLHPGRVREAPPAEETDFLPGGSGYDAYAGARGLLLAVLRPGGWCRSRSRPGQRGRDPRHAPAGRDRGAARRAGARQRRRDRQGGRARRRFGAGTRHARAPPRGPPLGTQGGRDPDRRGRARSTRASRST